MVVQQLYTLLKQQVVWLLLGYEEQNDHSFPRMDKAMIFLTDILGFNWKHCKVLGYRSQIRRLEQARGNSDSPDTNMFDFDQDDFNQ